MLRKKRIGYWCALLFLLLTVPAAANFSDSGTIPYPRPYTHTVQCNPGDSIQVSVSTNHPSSVDILYMTLANNQKAYNSVAKSQKKTSHYLEYTAPGGKPPNNMAYWHYVVAVHGSAQNPTKYSVQIVQKSGGLKQQSDAFDAKVKKKLRILFANLNNEHKSLVSRIKSNSAEINTMSDAQDRRRAKLESQKAELQQLKKAIETEKNAAVQSSLRNTYNSRLATFRKDVEQFKAVNARWRRIYDDNKALRAQRDEIGDLGRALNAAQAKNDFDQCAILANNSSIARKFGWSPISR